MKTTTLTINEINKQAETILIQQLGIANTLRFFNQFNQGNGDYTAQLHQ